MTFRRDVAIHPPALFRRPIPRNDTACRVVTITLEQQTKNTAAIGEFMEERFLEPLSDWMEERFLEPLSDLMEERFLEPLFDWNLCPI